MASWTISGGSDKARLIAHAETALPRFFSRSPRGREDLQALAEVMANGVLAPIRDLLRMTYIQDSDGKWLRQHAKDRGTGPQAGESEAALKRRLVDIEDAVTRPVLLAAIQDKLDDAGVVGPLAMVELPRDGGFFGDHTARSGTGGVFSTALAGGGLRAFTPTSPFPLPLRVGAAALESGAFSNPRLVISGAAVGGNNGTFQVTALEANAAIFSNATGANSTDATVAWEVRKFSAEGTSIEGRARCYLGRGYRGCSRPGATIIAILPFGTPDAVAEAVREVLRQKKAGGIKHVVEVRAVP